MATPLADLRILDLTRVLAGPVAAQYFGDMGADVIKIEPIDHGDDMRIWPPFRKSLDGSVTTGTPYFGVNRSKRSIALDLKAEAGREVLWTLVKRADIVMESFAPRVAARLGIDAVTARGLNPRLIHCSISGFGSVGPMRMSKGYDLIAQAFAGMLSITGERDGPPIRTPYSPVDQVTGLHAMVGILAALHAREATGVGAAIEVSLFDSATGLLGHMLQNYWERGTEPARYGVGHESLCPYEAFETADTPLILGVANDTMWRVFCGLAGLEAYIDDPRFRTNGERVRNRLETVALVRPVLLRKPRNEWCEIFEKAGIPCSPLHTLGDLATHPHSRASGMVFDYQHPQFGPMSAVAQPVRYEGERADLRRAPPGLGEHSVEVLREAGFDDTRIDSLAASGVIRSAKKI
jgi:crotonobetainyl-CoA:carnitine CoA-transferase CaiB-like acyl-CoA transferase